MTQTGVIIATCTSSRRGLPKYLKPGVIVTEHGLSGDWHCRPRRVRFTSKEVVSNVRHVTIISREAQLAAAAELGIEIPLGGTGDNLSVVGLGDLSDVEAGVRFRLGSEVEVEVYKQNDPCSNLRPLHPRLGKMLYGKRGLLCTIIEGVGKRLEPGDAIVRLS